MMAMFAMSLVTTFAQSKDGPQESLITSINREGYELDFGSIYLKIDNDGGYCLGLFDAPLISI